MTLTLTITCGPYDRTQALIDALVASSAQARTVYANSTAWKKGRHPSQFARLVAGRVRRRHDSSQ